MLDVNQPKKVDVHFEDNRGYHTPQLLVKKYADNCFTVRTHFEYTILDVDVVVHGKSIIGKGARKYREVIMDAISKYNET